MASTYHHGNLEAALLDEAVEAVRRRGAENVSLRALASSVGVSPSAAYQHFGDKDDLLAAVGQSGFARLVERMRAEVARVPGDSGADAVRRLEAVGYAYVGFAIDEPHLFRLMFGPLCHKLGDELKAAREAGAEPTPGQDAYGMLEWHLDDLDRRGLLTRPADEALRLLVWSVVHGFASLAIEGQLDPGAVQPLLQTLRGLLFRD